MSEPHCSHDRLLICGAVPPKSPLDEAIGVIIATVRVSRVGKGNAGSVAEAVRRQC